MTYLNYNTDTFNFYEIISKSLNVVDLKNIHLTSEFKYTSKCERMTDQSTHWHREFYKLARTDEFIELYTNFIRSVILPKYDSSIVYQSIPTFRIHFPNNIAVGEYHRDREYRDGKWASIVNELNLFLPITSAFDTNTIWVESHENRGDYAPMNANYGDVVMWDGSNLKHGNKTNKESTTRISMDFRVIDYANYIPSDYGSINTNTQFKIGGYYSKM